MTELPTAIVGALRRMGLLARSAPPPAAHRLVGGVSSDIWRVDLPSGPVCVKRALERLLVAAEWRAPVERTLYEARWMRRASAAVPGCAPKLLGHDRTAWALAMEYLEPAAFPVWKSRLRDGETDARFAGAVGATLASIHAATAAESRIAAEFPSDEIFHAIRLEPYLLATARAHPDLARELTHLAAVTARTHAAMVHGDVSPKNILAGPGGPVFLDAECAWWGDPAFDLAFCLNHLLLKCLWVPWAREGFLGCFDALSDAYLRGVNWEPRAALEARTARLLGGLLLARVDGKSPVEYIVTDADRDRVRRAARVLLTAMPERVDEVRAVWINTLG